MKTSFDLSELGINNIAHLQLTALEQLVKFKDMGIAVYGGDVFILDGNDIYLSYDNWYCARKKTENLYDYISRSIKEAEQFIKNYHTNQGIPLFAFVFSTTS